MLPMKAFVASCLLAVAFVQCTFAFVSVSSGSMFRPSSPSASVYHLHSVRSSGKALRMADGDNMSAAEEKAKRLIDQAAALRESAAASEAEIRPPSNSVDAVEEAKPAPVIRPEDMPPKPKISNDMRERLKKELTSQGADPNKSAGNPILVVAGIIAVLVIVGGQGIFY